MKHKVIAVDIGGTETIVAIVNNNMEIIEEAKFKTLQNFSDEINSIVEEADKLDPIRKLSVGVAICGLLSLDGKRLLVAPNMKWKDCSLTESFGRLDRDFIVVNDGTAASWASFITENPHGVTRLLSMTLGTGVGGGVVIDGNPLIGAGELGHIKVLQEGPYCGCGKRGCLEALAGGRNMPERAKEWFGLDVDSPEDLYDLAESGDTRAIECWKRVGGILGYALSGVVNLNGIQAITIGGKISRAEKYFLESLQKSLTDNLMVPEFQSCSAYISKWEHNFSLMGAAAIVLKPPRNHL